MLIFISLTKVYSENGTLSKVQTAVSFMLAEMLKYHFKVMKLILIIESPFVNFSLQIEDHKSHIVLWFMP